LVEKLSPHFDYNLHSERAARQKFLDIGATPLWWPMAANPKYFKPNELPRTLPVSFLGGNYALRTRYVLSLLRAGIGVHAFGPGWLGGARTRFRSWCLRYLLLARTVTAPANDHPRASAMLADHDLRRYLATQYPDNVHGPLDDDEAIGLYSRSELALGFVEVFEEHDPTRPICCHVHLREFEAPMCRAAYCTGYVEELGELYDLGKEVIVYRSQEELVDLVKFYLSRPDLLECIRAAGYRRALASHTYHKRYVDLFKMIGIG
jgi:spore maturation protein CgeB